MSIPETIYYTPPDACDVPINGTIQFEKGKSKHDIEYRRVGVCEWTKNAEYLNLYSLNCDGKTASYYKNDTNFCHNCGNKIKVVT